MTASNINYIKLIETLNRIGIALSSEKDYTKLLELILSGAMDLTNADAGTIYLLDSEDKNKLVFTILSNRSLNIPSTAANLSGLPIHKIPLYVDDEPNLNNIATYCFHKNETVNIEDAYNSTGFDFTGTRIADDKLGYHSKSLLTIPLRDHQNLILGVLQLINAKDVSTGDIISFDDHRLVLAESLASQAAITLTKHELILSQKRLFDALLKLIARAIDEKSIYTSNHCSRVPVLTTMIANAMNNVSEGILKDYQLSKDELEELLISAWLHDCGKIVTPDYVMNKATKLETLTDRIEVIYDRIEILKRDAKIIYLERLLNEKDTNNDQAEIDYSNRVKYLEDIKEFITKLNYGGEYLSDNDLLKIRITGTENTYLVDEMINPLLTDEDINNLSIRRGTLNDKERAVINNHVVVTREMLKTLPYPEHLKNVPEIAGAHHERIDGKGYPRGIDIKSMSIQARILAIADIFEALTSADRPYKKPNTLSEVLRIMDDMKKSGHIDPNLFDLFVREKVYLKYAKEYLKPDQINI